MIVQFDYHNCPFEYDQTQRVAYRIGKGALISDECHYNLFTPSSDIKIYKNIIWISLSVIIPDVIYCL